MPVDTHIRSLVKAISWRVTGTIDTIVITYIVTRHLKTAFSIGFLELFTKIFWYFLHERIWDRLKFGRKPPPEDYSI